MISYIKGALGAVEDDVIVVETGGIGLAVHVPLSLLEELPALGEEVTDALNDLSDRFLIYNISFAKFDFHAESFLYLTF